MDAIEHVFELIPAYVLGSLDEDESFQVFQHLANCSVCQNEWRAYETVSGQLMIAVPEVAPPDALRTRLLKSVDHSFRQERISPQKPVQERLTWRTFWQRLWTWRTPVWVGISLILILAVNNILLWKQIDSLQEKITDTTMIVHPLHAVASDVLSTGIVVMDPRGDYGTIIVDSLPPSKEGQQYQVWLSRDDQVVSGGVFDIHKNGYGAQVIYAPEPLHLYTHVWVTIEPEGGSPQPSGITVLQTD